MKVVILCGGRGTRLRQETEFKPKPIVEIGGYPILWHIMKIYSYYGFNDFILCLGYKGELIREYILNYEVMQYDCTVHIGNKNSHITFNGKPKERWNVTLVDTGQNTETGMRIKMVEPFIGKNAFMFTYGDGLANINVEKLLKLHRSKKKIATITGVYPVERYGIIDLDSKSNVKTFLEKPKVCNQINAGFAVCEPEFFKYIKGNVPLEIGPLPLLTKKRQIACFQHSGFWHCMDTFRDYLYLNEVWKSDNVPWRVWKKKNV